MTNLRPKSAAIARRAGGILTPGMWRILASALFLSLNGACIRYAGREVGVFQIVVFRCLVGGILCLILGRGDLGSLLGKNRKVLCLRGLFGVCAMLLSFYAYTVLPVAEATLIFFINPVFVALLAWAFLGEHMSLGQLVCVGVSFAGVVLVSNPATFASPDTGLSPWGVGTALAGALFAAAAMVTIRALGRTERTLSPMFYLNMFSFAVSAPLAVFTWENCSWASWGCLLAIGLLAHAGQYFMTSGLAMEKAGRGSAVGYFQIVFAVVWGMLFFAEYPDLLAVFGSGLIMSGTLGLRERPRGAPHP